MATLSLCLALLLLVGGFFYRNELRLTQEIQLLARALNSQQQELDRALQDLSTLQSYVNFTTQQNAANDERISGALKQLEESLLTVDVIGQSLRQRVANLDNHGPTGAATPPANGHSDKKP
jgi:predicted  nucleic acid-binding Zn-ribbon protein